MEGVGGSTLSYCMYVHTYIHIHTIPVSNARNELMGSIHCAFTSTYIARYRPYIGRSLMGEKTRIIHDERNLEVLVCPRLSGSN